MDNFDAYKSYVRSRLESLRPVFANAAVGDFSSDLALPDADDEFTELYVGIKIMLEVIRGQLRELNQANQSLESRVNERNKELLSAQKMAHIGSWTWDMHKNQVTISPEMEKIYGFQNTNNLNYADLLDRLPLKEKEKFDRLIRESSERGQSFEMTHKVNSDGDRIKMVQTTGEVDLDKNGNPWQIRGTCQDITESVEAESKLRSRTEELERLNNFMIDRELKMAELKKRIEELEKIKK